MMKAIQRFGGALFTPAMLFAFAGVVVGLGTLFTTEAIMGPIAAADTTWTKAWTVVLDGGWTVFNQLPLLFAVALPIGLAKRQAGRCCLEAFISYLTFNYFVSSMLSSWAPGLGVDFSASAGSAQGVATIAGIRTLDMGVAGALLVSGVVIVLHNRLFDTHLPEWLGAFSGGLIEMSSLDFVPLAATHGQTYLVALAIGLCFSAVYFVVFRFLILRLDLRTPGRAGEGDVRLNTQDEYRDAHGMPRAQDGRRLGADGEKADVDREDAYALRLVELLGGAGNIEGITSCATRLRVDVRDPGRVAAGGAFVAAGARGAVCAGRAVQVIVGLNVTQVAERVERALGLDG